LATFFVGQASCGGQGVKPGHVYCTDPQGRSLPVNYRVYDKAEKKTKNDYFQDRLEEVLAWGLWPAFMTGDSWYACEKNRKKVKNHLMGFVFAVASNRVVSMEKGVWTPAQKLDIPEDGLIAWLRDSGQVKQFRTRLKDQLRHYVVYLPKTEVYPAFKQTDFQTLHDRCWSIEQYHRTIKQVCNIERFQVRSNVAILNYLFASLCGFIQLQRMQLAALIGNAYQFKREPYADVISAFIRSFIPDKQHLNPQFQGGVNA
jgi:hypothetical protein